jgi:hypothetical protein
VSILETDRSVPSGFCATYGNRESDIDDCQVDPSKLPCLAQWKRENTMETVLIELRRLVPMHTWRMVINTKSSLDTWLILPTRSFPSQQRDLLTLCDTVER